MKIHQKKKKNDFSSFLVFYDKLVTHDKNKSMNPVIKWSGKIVQIINFSPSFDYLLSLLMLNFKTFISRWSSKTLTSHSKPCFWRFCSLLLVSSSNVLDGMSYLLTLIFTDFNFILLTKERKSDWRIYHIEHLNFMNLSYCKHMRLIYEKVPSALWKHSPDVDQPWLKGSTCI